MSPCERPASRPDPSTAHLSPPQRPIAPAREQLIGQRLKELHAHFEFPYRAGQWRNTDHACGKGVTLLRIFGVQR